MKKLCILFLLYSSACQASQLFSSLSQVFKTTASIEEEAKKRESDDRALVKCYMATRESQETDAFDCHFFMAAQFFRIFTEALLNAQKTGISPQQVVSEALNSPITQKELIESKEAIEKLLADNIHECMIDGELWLPYIRMAWLTAAQRGFFEIFYSQTHDIAIITAILDELHKGPISCPEYTLWCDKIRETISLNRPCEPVAEKSTSFTEKLTSLFQRNPTDSLPLHAAARMNQRDIVILLLQNGASPKLVDRNTGLNALAVASEQKNEDIAQLIRVFCHFSRVLSNLKKRTGQILCKLIEFCPALASLSIVDKTGNNLLHKAVQSNDPDLSLLLLERNPRLLLTPNSDGQSPMHLAVGHASVLQKILTYAFGPKKSL